MTATQTQLRRGTSSQCNSMTPAEGEIIIDLTNDRPRLGDGSTAGGIHLPNYSDILKQSFGFAIAGGTADALTLTLAASTSYAQPLTIFFKATATNTGAATIDVNGLGAKNLYKVSGGAVTAVAAGDIVNGGLYMAIYDGTQFQVYGLTSEGLTSVSQGDLNTSLGSVSTTLDMASATLPGGEYGFWPQVSHSNANIQSFMAPVIGFEGVLSATDNLNPLLASVTSNHPPTSYTSRINYGTRTGTLSVQQRYVTSSPPFDLGDGDVGGFIYIQVNGAGEAVQHYAADVPPWAYNGPTNIRCDRICPVTKKKFRKSMKKLTPKQIMDGAKIEYEMQEITHEIKNADMWMYPHPFEQLPGHKIILIDPMSDKVQRLIEIQNKGDSSIIGEMVNKGYLRADTDKVSRKGPNGVNICAAKFKAT